MGITPNTKVIQSESMDMDLRNSLWNALIAFYWALYKAPYSGGIGRGDYVNGSNLHQIAIAIYMFHYKKPIDTIEVYWEYFLQEIRTNFYKLQWYEVYDFIEFIVQNGPIQSQKAFIESCNAVLQRENSAYRFIGGTIGEITSTEEVAEIEEALESASNYQGVRVHLDRALKLLADKQNPDYRNSMKESISAVEALAKHLTGNPKATLGEALTELERRHRLDPVLKKAFSTLYGYTNNSDGIRHAVMADKQVLTKADARFLLICCSAFINLTIDSVED
jgi:hypothetical protein